MTYKPTESLDVSLTKELPPDVSAAGEYIVRTLWNGITNLLGVARLSRETLLLLLLLIPTMVLWWLLVATTTTPS